MKSMTTLMRLLLLTTLSFSVACGSDKDSDSEANQIYKSGTCGSSVRLRYNSVVTKCYYVWLPTKEDHVACKEMAKSFLDTYPEINCATQEWSPVEGQNKDVNVTEKKLQTLIKDLENRGY